MRAGAVAVASCVAAAGLFVSTAASAGDDAATAGGLKVFVDPATGQILSAPPQGGSALALTPAEQNAFSTSHDGLTQTPSAKPGGGYRLDLKGRFQSSLIATVGPDGKPQVRHVGGAAPTEQAK